ncbi:hypothetical protein ACFL20_06510 [Spirochaetota bacterium]
MSKKPYKSVFEEKDNSFGVLNNLDRAIEKYEEAKQILIKSALLEATNVSTDNFMTKMNQADNLLHKAVGSLIKIQRSDRDISIELYVKCRLKLVGTNTALSKEYSVSSWYSGANVRSLLIEMEDMGVTDIFRSNALGSSRNRYTMICVTYNETVEDYKDELVIKKYNQLIIPDELILTHKE